MSVCACVWVTGGSERLSLAGERVNRHNSTRLSTVERSCSLALTPGGNVIATITREKNAPFEGSHFPLLLREMERGRVTWHSRRGSDSPVHGHRRNGGGKPPRFPRPSHSGCRSGCRHTYRSCCWSALCDQRISTMECISWKSGAKQVPYRFANETMYEYLAVCSNGCLSTEGKKGCQMCVRESRKDAASFLNDTHP